MGPARDLLKSKECDSAPSKLRGSYPKREMCVQYRESCLAFVSRLLEEEGIAYWFAHDSDGHVLVLGDDPKAFAPLPEGEELPYRVEEPRFGTETWRGEGTCQRLAPRCVFEVSGHPSRASTCGCSRAPPARRRRLVAPSECTCGVTRGLARFHPRWRLGLRR